MSIQELRTPMTSLLGSSLARVTGPVPFASLQAAPPSYWIRLPSDGRRSWEFLPALHRTRCSFPHTFRGNPLCLHADFQSVLGRSRALLGIVFSGTLAIISLADDSAFTDAPFGFRPGTVEDLLRGGTQDKCNCHNANALNPCKSKPGMRCGFQRWYCNSVNGLDHSRCVGCEGDEEGEESVFPCAEDESNCYNEIDECCVTLLCN